MQKVFLHFARPSLDYTEQMQKGGAKGTPINPLLQKEKKLRKKKKKVPITPCLIFKNEALTNRILGMFFWLI